MRTLPWAPLRPQPAVPSLSHPAQRVGPHTACSMTEAGSPPPAAGKGLVEAAHFCYLVAHVPFGHYTVKTDHLALLGSSHRYVVFWGWEWEGCFPGDWFSPCWVSRFPSSCVNFSYSFSPLLGLFCRGLGREVPSGCCITPAGGLRPQSCSQNCAPVPLGCIVPL